MTVLSFGDLGLPRVAIWQRAALRDLSFCAMEARTVSYMPALRQMWLDWALEAHDKAIAYGATADALRDAWQGRLL